MAVQLFLGRPHESIVEWIKGHPPTPPEPVGHPETIFTFVGGQTVSKNISGTLDRQWLIDNGFFDGETWEWKKITSEIDIGNIVTSIGDSAFFYCLSLTSIIIPNSMKIIGYEAFYGCSGLTSVTIPDSVTNIGSWAFGECSGLTSVTFQGKTLTQVQAMDNYNTWGIEDTSIINVA